MGLNGTPKTHWKTTKGTTDTTKNDTGTRSFSEVTE